MENKEEKKISWLKYQMINHYLYIFIGFVLAGILIPVIEGMDYILVLPFCFGIAILIAVLANRAYKIYERGGTS